MKRKTTLEVKDLHVSFKLAKKQKVEIVRGVDIKIHEKEIVGIVGESGSGKSVTTKTLLNLNTGAITQSETMSIDGIDMTTFKNKD